MFIILFVNFQTVIVIFIIVNLNTTFHPVYPLAFLRCLFLNQGIEMIQQSNVKNDFPGEITSIPR